MVEFQHHLLSGDRPPPSAQVRFKRSLPISYRHCVTTTTATATTDISIPPNPTHLILPIASLIPHTPPCQSTPSARSTSTRWTRTSSSLLTCSTRTRGDPTGLLPTRSASRPMCGIWCRSGFRAVIMIRAIASDGCPSYMLVGGKGAREVG
jgi:hypothetical protein